MQTESRNFKVKKKVINAVRINYTIRAIVGRPQWLPTIGNYS